MAASASPQSFMREVSVESLQKMHQSLEERLNELDRHKALTPEEKFEVQIIKKRKLALKDRIQELKAGEGPSS